MDVVYFLSQQKPLHRLPGRLSPTVRRYFSRKLAWLTISSRFSRPMVESHRRRLCYFCKISSSSAELRIHTADHYVRIGLIIPAPLRTPTPSDIRPILSPATRQMPRLRPFWKMAGLVHTSLALIPLPRMTSSLRATAAAKGENRKGDNWCDT